MNCLANEILKAGIVPVIKLQRPDEDAFCLAEALCKGGVNVAEITFRAEGADRAISIFSKNFDDIIVGAGTIFTVEQGKKAVEAGAKFIVSPGFDKDLVEYCIEVDVPIFPGCTTPTEIQQAMKYDLKIVKFFPAEQSGGLNKIKALSGPFSSIKFMPTGGISLVNLGEYISFSSVAACGGSYMVTDKLINEKNWDEITRLCQMSVAVVKKARKVG